MFPPPTLAWPILAASWAPLGVSGVSGVQSPDSAALRDQARNVQVRFERLRVRKLPRTAGGGSHRCDETIGRLCIWDEDDDEWKPKPDPPAIVRARDELLTSLAVLADSIPGDHWVFGQRMRYLAEADRLKDAQALATGCGLPDRWRCDAYLGFALHLQGFAVAAATVFDRALAALPDDLRAEWTDPRPLLTGRLRHWVDDQPDSANAVARLWTLADPLFLAAGNDRWTGHLARWTYAMSSEGARNPHGMRWASDLTQAAVRYGWSVAWEKGWPRAWEATPTVVGRDPPAAYRTFPPADVLEPTEGDAVVAWKPPPGHARSAYLPPYLDSLGVLDGQIGRFWRRERVVVVAVASGPRKATAGLFLVKGRELALDLRTVPDSTGAVRFVGEVAPTRWGVASLEVWDRPRRRAQRLRASMGLGPVLPDVFALSDLVLLEPASANPAHAANPATGANPANPAIDPALPTTFQQMVASLRPSTEATGAEALGVALEVYGLGYRSEAVGFRAWVEDPDPGALRRLARRIGVGGPPEQVALEWTEAGPDQPGPLFRAFRVRLPDLDPGTWEVAVEVTVPGRAPLIRKRAFTVPNPR